MSNFYNVVCLQSPHNEKLLTVFIPKKLSFKKSIEFLKLEYINHIVIFKFKKIRLNSQEVRLLATLNIHNQDWGNVKVKIVKFYRAFSPILLISNNSIYPANIDEKILKNYIDKFGEKYILQMLTYWNSIKTKDKKYINTLDILNNNLQQKIDELTIKDIIE